MKQKTINLSMVTFRDLANAEDKVQEIMMVSTEALNKIYKTTTCAVAKDIAKKTLLRTLEIGKAGLKDLERGTDEVD